MNQQVATDHGNVIPAKGQSPDREVGTVGTAFLVTCAMVTGAVAMIYQFAVISSLSFILGDTIVIFAISMGVFLLSLGVGSHVAGRTESHGAARLVRTQYWLGALGFLALPAIFCLFGGIERLAAAGIMAQSSIPGLLLWAIGLLSVFGFGFLAGMQIPIWVQICDERGLLHAPVARLLGYDYVGSFIGALLFPLVLFPHLGLFRSAFIAALLNILIAGTASLILVEGRTRPKLIVMGIWTGLIIAAFLGAPQIQDFVTWLVYDG